MMADVTGPISSLPGATHSLPEGATCDQHPDRPAVVRVQGETDSFGCEMIDMCEECRQVDLEEQRTADTSGTCEWCKQHAPRLRNRRDYEEGMCGRVYQVCDACIQRENDDLEKEMGTYWDD